MSLPVRDDIKLTLSVIPAGIGFEGRPKFTFFWYLSNPAKNAVEVSFDDFKLFTKKAACSLAAGNLSFSKNGKDYTPFARSDSSNFDLDDRVFSRWKKIFGSKNILLPASGVNELGVQSDGVETIVRDTITSKLQTLTSSALDVSDDLLLFNLSDKQVINACCDVGVDLESESIGERMTAVSLALRSENKTVESIYKNINKGGERSLNKLEKARQESINAPVNEPDDTFDDVYSALSDHPVLAEEYLGVAWTITYDTKDKYWASASNKNSFTELKLAYSVPVSDKDCWRPTIEETTLQNEFTVFSDSVWIYRDVFINQSRYYHGLKDFGLIHRNNGHTFTTTHPHRRSQNGSDFLTSSINKYLEGNGMPDQGKMRAVQTEGLYLLEGAAEGGASVQSIDEELVSIGQRVLVSIKPNGDDNKFGSLNSLTSRVTTYTNKDNDEVISQYPEQGWMRAGIKQDGANEGEEYRSQIVFYWSGDNLAYSGISTDESDKVYSGGETSNENGGIEGVSPILYKLGVELEYSGEKASNVWLSEGQEYQFLIDQVRPNGWCMPLKSDNKFELSFEHIWSGEYFDCCDDTLDSAIFNYGDCFELSDPVQPPVILGRTTYDPDDQSGSSQDEVSTAQNIIVDQIKESRSLFPPRIEYKQIAFMGGFRREKITNESDSDRLYVKRCMDILERSIKIPPRTSQSTFPYVPDPRAKSLVIIASDWFTTRWLKEATIDQPDNQLLYGEEGRIVYQLFDIDVHQLFDLYGRKSKGWEVQSRVGRAENSIKIDAKNKVLLFTATRGCQLKFEVGFTGNEHMPCKKESLLQRMNIQLTEDAVNSNPEAIRGAFGGLFLGQYGTNYKESGAPTTPLNMHFISRTPLSVPEIKVNPGEKLRGYRFGEAGNTQAFYEFELENYHPLTTRFIRLLTQYGESSDAKDYQPSLGPVDSIQEKLRGEYSAKEAFYQESPLAVESNVYHNNIGLEFTLSEENLSNIRKFNDNAQLLKYAFANDHYFTFVKVGETVNFAFDDKPVKGVNIADSDDYSLSLKYALVDGDLIKGFEVAYTKNERIKESYLDDPAGILPENRQLACVVSLVSSSDKNFGADYVVDIDTIGLPVKDLSYKRLSLAEDVDAYHHFSNLRVKNKSSFFVYTDLKTSGYREYSIKVEATGAFAKFYFDIDDDNVDELRVVSSNSVTLEVYNYQEPKSFEPEFKPMLANSFSTDNWKKSSSTKYHWMIEVERGQEEVGDDWSIALLLNRKDKAGKIYELSGVGRDITSLGDYFEDSSLNNWLIKDSVNYRYLKKYFRDSQDGKFSFMVGGDEYECILLEPFYLFGSDKWVALISFDFSDYQNEIRKAKYNPFAKLTLAKCQPRSEGEFQLSRINEPEYLPLFSDKSIRFSRRGGDHYTIKIDPQAIKRGEGDVGEVSVLHQYTVCVRLKRGDESTDNLLGKLIKSECVSSIPGNESVENTYFHSVIPDKNSNNVEFTLKPHRDARDLDYELCVYEFERFNNSRGFEKNENPFQNTGLRLTHSKKFELES